MKLHQIYLACKGTSSIRFPTRSVVFCCFNTQVSFDEYDSQHVDHTPVKIPPFRLKPPRRPH